ncbi:hypothetical protein MNBD_ALPHA06-2248 [hydrothermal vent metagenome]|uniref:SPOR domain-containing protein n=1 Tax=hydrothermal vent metagenome TaxID=652676 RepID=A0A3B0S9M7_9ZZZZ
MKISYLIVASLALPLLAACVSDDLAMGKPMATSVKLTQEEHETAIAVGVILGRLRQVEGEANWQSLDGLRPQIYQLATALLPSGAPSQSHVTPSVHPVNQPMTPPQQAQVFPVSAPVAAAPLFSKPPKLANARSMFFAIQLGSYRTADQAFAGWDGLVSRAPQAFAGLRPRIERVDLGSRGVFLRLKAGPISSAVNVQARCSALATRGINCSQADFTGADRG